MDNAVKAILIGASVVIVMAIVTIGFRVLSGGQDVVDSSMDSLTTTVSNINDPLVKRDNGAEIEGQKVLSYVKGELKDISVYIKTGNSSSYYYYNKECSIDGHSHGTCLKGAVGNLNNITKNEYINISGKFLVDVKLDKSGLVNCVKFTQQ